MTAFLICLNKVYDLFKIHKQEHIPNFTTRCQYSLRSVPLTNQLVTADFAFYQNTLTKGFCYFWTETDP